MYPLRILSRELISHSFFTWWVLVSVVFFLFSLVLVNIQTLSSFLFVDYALGSKIRILGQLYIGAFQAISPLDLVLIATISVLFGLNLVIVFRKIDFLRKRGHLRFTFGAGLASLVASGCASCGLSVASIVGLTGAIALLPFGGIELYFLAVALLCFSLWINARAIYKECRLQA